VNTDAERADLKFLVVRYGALWGAWISEKNSTVKQRILLHKKQKRGGVSWQYIRNGCRLLFVLHRISGPPETFRLRNDLYCVGWGVKLYSLTQQGHWELFQRLRMGCLAVDRSWQRVGRLTQGGQAASNCWANHGYNGDRATAVGVLFFCFERINNWMNTQ